MKNLLITFALFAVCFPAIAAESKLFDYKGKGYKLSDLEKGDQQALYDIQKESHEKMTQYFDSVIFNMHIKELAKKKGKTFEAMQDEILKTKEPTEKEAKKWFEENKKRVPYPYDKIKKDIFKLLVGEGKRKKYTELVAKLKSKGGFKVALSLPKAPTFSLKVDGFPQKGNPKAKVKIVEFADYKCPHCKHANDALNEVFKKFKNKASLVFVHYPVDRTGVASAVAEGSWCAMEQKKFWEYHNMAFDLQPSLSKKSPDEIAKKLKLDDKKFKACLSSKKYGSLATKGKAEGERVGVNATPTIFINGRKVKGHDAAEFEALIRKEL